MNYRKIAQIEREFPQSPVYRINRRAIDFGHNEVLEVYECEPRLSPLNFFYQEEFDKKRIVLHFTAGQLQGDIATLTGERGRVSVPFVIARDGKIYRLFSSKFWSYHLGPGALGGNTPQSQQTIGIELSNFGPLYRRQDKLYCWTHNAYCTIQETKQYIKLDDAYRGYLYFANYTEAQYASLKVLLRYLCQTYAIPHDFLPLNRRFLTQSEVLHFNGVVAHVNYRTDKFDIGPAFDWNKLTEPLQIPQNINIPRDASMRTEAGLDQGKIFVAAEANIAELEGLGF